MGKWHAVLMKHSIYTVVRRGGGEWGTVTLGLRSYYSNFLESLVAQLRVAGYATKSFALGVTGYQLLIWKMGCLFCV